MRSLKKKKLKLSIDNFGTGYSSLGILNNLPLEELKIDQSFIGKLSISNYYHAVVASIIYLAKSLGVKTIAVGVETEDKLQFLVNQKYDYYQGFLYRKPVPASEIKTLF